MRQIISFLPTYVLICLLHNVCSFQITYICTITTKKMFLPKLIDYFVHIPPGSSSDAFCETIITWKNTSFEFTTRGFDSDQTVSAIKATEKMLNSIDTNK